VRQPTLQGPARKGANIEARAAHSIRTAAMGDDDQAHKTTSISRGRAAAGHLPRLPADQRELCIGVDFEYAAHERWERIAAS